MKKLLYLFSFIALSGLLFTSCEETEPVGPSIQITSGESVTVPANSSIVIKWRADAGDAKLDIITIREGNTPIDDWDDVEIENADNETYIDSAEVSVGESNTSFEIEVVDKDGEIATATVDVTIEEGAGEINTYPTVTLGGQSNATLGSSFASIDGQVYSWSDATTNSAKIDFVAFYGSDSKYVLAAPSDATAQTAFTAVSLDLAGWTTKNATKFKKVTLTGTWADITDDEVIVTLATGLTSSKVDNLVVDEIIAFETASTSENAGKKGLIKITEVSGTDGSNRKIVGDIKVQK